jgi:hypothetical protein
MEFQPSRAASIFFLAVNSPLVFATAVISAWPLIAIAAAAVCAAATWCLFFLGAKVARRPHTPKSILYSVLLTWSFSFSISGLVTHFASDGGPWLDVLDVAVSLTFVFFVGWRLAPTFGSSESRV